MNMYAVVSRDGKYLRSKGYSGYGECWVDNMQDAKIWIKPGPPKAQITWWARKYPDYGIPRLVILDVSIKTIEEQEKRVNKSIKKIEKKQAKYQKWNDDYRTKQLQQQKEAIEKELNKLENKTC